MSPPDQVTVEETRVATLPMLRAMVFAKYAISTRTDIFIGLGGDYDLVCIGSPTWWLRTSVPVRSYLKSDAAGRVLKGKHFAAFVVCRRYWGLNLKRVKKLGTKQGGEYIDGIHFTFAGGQIRSFMALISYFAKGENRERYLGVKIPPTNIQDYHLEAARTFADGLANRLASPAS